jgi:predicted nucleic-acid-binding Zn-ribbon protein
MTRTRECSECGGRNLYETTASSGGGHAPNYLPRLGSFWASARFRIVVCQDCGLTRFFASEEARRRLNSAKKWARVP